MKLKKVCAWCKTVIHVGGQPDAPVSSGICAMCLMFYFGLSEADLAMNKITIRLLVTPLSYKDI